MLEVPSVMPTILEMVLAIEDTLKTLSVMQEVMVVT